MSTATTNLSERLIGKEEKTQPPNVDSGFLSCENLSSENLSAEMRVESGLCGISEDFSNMKLSNPSINDLSATSKTEPQCRVNATDRCKFYEQDEEGDTFLHAAVAQCRPEIVLGLIRSAPNSQYLDIANDDGFTALHLAVETRQWRVARWLVAAGAARHHRNFRGESPLHAAARLGSSPCCRAIIEPVQQRETDFLNLSYRVASHRPVDLDQWNYEGQTSVHVAAVNGHIDVLRVLIWYGADVNAREGRSGYTALHYAIENRDEKLAYFLLTECDKLNADVATYGGRSVLQLGLSINEDLMQNLQSRGVASPYSTEDESIYDSDETSPVYIPQLVNGCA